MRIVVGLGNPGRKYRRTRHNIGWMALDELAAVCGVRGDEDVPGGVLVRCGETWLFRPLSYMNMCGPPVASLCRWAGADLADLLVVVDDLNLPLGALRLRPQGSSGARSSSRASGWASGPCPRACRGASSCWGGSCRMSGSRPRSWRSRPPAPPGAGPSGASRRP